MQRKYIDPDDAPPLTGDELERPDTKWRIGKKEVSAEEGKAAFHKAWKRKTRTNIHLDNDVIAHYRAQAGARGYQTLINAALRRDMEGGQLKEKLLRSVKADLPQMIRTELRSQMSGQSVTLLELKTPMRGAISKEGLVIYDLVVGAPSADGLAELKRSAEAQANSGAMTFISPAHGTA